MTVRSVAVLAVVLGLLWISGAEMSEVLLCGGQADGGCCGDLAERPGSSEERACDHCVACSASHGHLQSLVSRSSSASPGLGVDRDLALPRTLVIEPRSGEIFHPPLPPAC